MESVILYHNPRCGKSRAALALLQERGISVQTVEYLKNPLSLPALRKLQDQIGLPPSQWVRSGEPPFKEEGLSAQSSDAEILAAMAKHPILIERPIAVLGNRAIVGRPPEKVLELVK